MEFCDLQVKRFPERFVLNPLDADDVEASHGFTEQSLDLLKFIRRVLQGDPLGNEKRHLLCRTVNGTFFYFEGLEPLSFFLKRTDWQRLMWSKHCLLFKGMFLCGSAPNAPRPWGWKPPKSYTTVQSFPAVTFTVTELLHPPCAVQQ